MAVLQLVYSKLPPSESPWKKTGFHTLLVDPTLPRTTVTAIESAIHYPGASTLPGEKTVVHWLPVNGQPHLILLVVRTLGQERDEFGREGLFVAHAFLAPPDVWRQLPTPLALLPQVHAHVPTSVEAIRQLPGADWTTGHLAPLHLTLAEAGSSTVADVPDALLLALCKQAAGTWTDGLVLHGPAETILTLVSAVWARLPKDLWPKLGIDPLFDGGKLFFFPLQTVGYQTLEPSTGTPAVFELSEASFRPHPRLAELTAAATPYERYAQSVPQPVQLDACWAMSQALLGLGQGKPAGVPAAFWHANEGWLRIQAASHAAGAIPPAWAEWLSRKAAPAELAAWLLAGHPTAGLTALLVDLVPKYPRNLPDDRLPPLQQPALAATLAILNRKDGDAEAIAKLSPAHAHALVQHLVQETAHHARLAPLLDRLAPAERNALLGQTAGRALVQLWLSMAPSWPAAWQSIQVELATAMVTAGDLDIDNLTLARIQSLLATHLLAWAPLGFQRVYAWLEEQPAPSTHRELASLTTVPSLSGDLPEVIRQSQVTRDAYLDLLVQKHQYQPDALNRMGWGEAEIAEAMARRPPNLLGRFRRFLGV